MIIEDIEEDSKEDNEVRRKTSFIHPIFLEN